MLTPLILTAALAAGAAPSPPASRSGSSTMEGETLILDAATAVRLALEAHPSLGEAREHVEQTRAQRRQAIGQAKPQLEGKISGVRTRDRGVANRPVKVDPTPRAP